MRSISFWGKANPWSARLIIISLHLLLLAAAIITGRNLQEYGIAIHPGLFIAAVMLYLMAALYYPAKKDKSSYLSPLAFYKRQKTCDFLLGFTGIFMICFLSNTNPQVFPGFTALKASTIQPGGERPGAFDKGDPELKAIHLYKLSRSERRYLVKSLKKEIRQALHSPGNNTRKIGLLILTLLGAAALLLLVASLSCNLSCNGQEGASTLVAIFGTAAVIGLTVFAIRKIYEDNRLQRREKEKEMEEIYK